MTTREEFEAMLERYGLAAFGALPIESLHDAKDALLAAYDEQAARIAELEAAMECACDFLDALQKDTGVGDGTAFMLRAVLGRETKHGDDTDAG